MKNKCPSCLGELTLKGDHYYCPFCGESFPIAEIEKKPTAESNPNVSNQRVDSSLPPLSGEDIYDMCIKGSVVINCRDLCCTGSGFLLDERGYVITNAHVVTDDDNEDSENIEVVLAGRRYRAEIVCRGQAGAFDVAMLKIDPPTDGTALQIGDSSKVRNGETVYAIGNSLGEGLCITKGIVSDKDRPLNGFHSIMADVATNHGNSGGPLIDADGKVIAICVAGIDGAQGMRYFIPINEIMNAVKKYIK